MTYSDTMHCDDKRMLHVLKSEIEKMWNRLKESDFQDMESLKKLDESIQDYQEYKRSVN